MGKSLSKIGSLSSTRVIDCPNATTDNESNRSQRSVKDKVLEENLAYYAELEKEKVKILLLGSESCGKSTILEQLRLVYGDPYTEEELAIFLAVIHRNMLEGMKILIQQAKRLKISGRIECPRAMNSIESQSFNTGQYLPTHVLQSIGELWLDRTIQMTWSARQEYAINSTVSWFFDKCSQLATPGYLPDTADILHCYKPTNGVTSKRYVLYVGYGVWSVGWGVCWCGVWGVECEMWGGGWGVGSSGVRCSHPKCSTIGGTKQHRTRFEWRVGDIPVWS